jgi:hypothetical protein
VEQPTAMPIPTGSVAVKGDELSTEYLTTWQPRSEYNPAIDQDNGSTNVPFFEEDNLALPTSYMLQ